MKLTTVLLATLGIVAGCAQSPANDGIDPSSFTTSTDEGVICHNEVETGSRIKTRRVCTTQAEREQMAIDVKEAKQAMRRSRGLTPDTSADSVP